MNVNCVSQTKVHVLRGTNQETPFSNLNHSSTVNNFRAESSNLRGLPDFYII